MTHDRRILTTQKMAKELGMEGKDFLAFRKLSGFPTPVRGEKHHLWWDSLAINNYFDKVSNIQPESIDHDSIIMGRLAGGKGAREIPAHS